MTVLTGWLDAAWPPERAFTKHEKNNEPHCRNTLDEPRKTLVSGRSGVSVGTPLWGLRT